MNTIKTLCELIIAVVSGYGLLHHSGLLEGKFRRDMFIYYTNLSNLAVFLYFSLRLICSLFGLEKAKVIWAMLFSSDSAMAITLCIFTTFIIYHFILVPIIKRQRASAGEFGNIFSIGNLIVHYFVPLSTLIYWLIFADKEALGLKSVALWVAIPLFYACFAFIRALGGRNIDGTNSPYPYEFMDPTVIGTRRTIINIIVLFFAFCAMGFAFVLLSRLY